MNITIKNLPPRVHQRLKDRAKGSGRSLNQEVIACLAEKVESSRVDVDELLRSAANLRSLVNKKISLTQMQEDLRTA